MANLRVDQFTPAPPLTLADIIPVVPQPGTTAMQTTLADVLTLIGTPAISIADTAFVDAINGNDGTGTVGDLTKPFLTITGAQTAVVGGQTIHIWPGSYSENNLGKGSVNYYFSDGAILNCGAGLGFIDTGIISYTVTGEGVFNTTAGTIVSFLAGGTLFIEGKEVNPSNGQFIHTSLTATVYSNIESHVIAVAGDCVQLQSTSIVYLNTPVISSSGRIAVSVASGTSLYLNTDRIICSGANMFDLGGNAVIKGEMIYTGGGTALQSTGGNLNLKFYGDLINNTAALAFEYANASTGTVDFYGKIIGIGVTRVTGFAGTVTLHNELTTDLATSSITQTSGTIKAKSRITNLNAAVASYGIDLFAGGNLILENTIIKVTGGAESIHSAVPATPVKILGTLIQNIALSVNITDIAGGTIQTNANVE